MRSDLSYEHGSLKVKSAMHDNGETESDLIITALHFHAICWRRYNDAAGILNESRQDASLPDRNIVAY
jgi:hypothetical protein